MSSTVNQPSLIRHIPDGGFANSRSPKRQRLNLPSMEFCYPSKSDLTVLPEEMLEKIFEFIPNEGFLSGLDNVILTSKDWCRIALSVKKKWVDANQISSIAYGCKNPTEAVNCIVYHKLKGGNFKDLFGITDENLKNLIEKRPTLEYLSINSNMISNFSLGTLVELKSLELIRCNNIPETLLEKALQKLTKLKRLNLTGCTQISGDAVPKAIAHLTHLETLIVSGCNQLAETQLALMVKDLKKLKHLEISEFYDLKGNHLKIAIQDLPLTHLIISECNQIDEETVKEMVDNLPNLTHLTITNGYGITGNLLSSTHKSNLVYLNLSKCKNFALDAMVGLLNHLPELVELNISGCRLIGRNEEQLKPLLKSLKNLNSYKSPSDTLYPSAQLLKRAIR